MKDIDIKHACSFTGHRPERLNGLSEETVISWLSEQIKAAIEDGYTDFITGMQRGVDLWAAEIILEIRKENDSIRLICACAFPGMEKEWEQSWQERYQNVLKNADGQQYIGKRPGRKAFFDRNEWMVDHSSRLIAVYTGAHGGTLETIKYAQKKGIQVVQIKQKE